MAEDRRIKHSKERIRKAMLECLSNTGLEKITVKQICETADINRSTFYAHYSDPNELYGVLEQNMTDKINSHFERYKNKKISYREFLHVILQCFYDNMDLFLALYNNDSKSLKENTLHLLERYEYVPKSTYKPDRKYVLEYYINGIFSVITLWLREEPFKSINDMAELLYRLTYRPR